MADESVRQTIVVTNPQGFHMRPMAAFVEAAVRYPCNVKVARAGKPAVDGKSLLSLMGLVAVQGSELCIEVAGPDAAEAMQALVAVFQRNFDDEQESAR